MGSKAGEVCRVSCPLQDDCQLLDAFSEGLGGLQLSAETQAVNANASQATLRGSGSAAGPG